MSGDNKATVLTLVGLAITIAAVVMTYLIMEGLVNMEVGRAIINKEFNYTTP